MISKSHLRKSHTAMRNFGASDKSHQFRCISSVLTKSRKPPCLSNSFEVFYQITKTSSQIRTLIPKVNFTHCETHSLRNAGGVTQSHQSQVESHNIWYDSPTKPSECIPTAEPLQFTDKTDVSNITFIISKSRENRTRYCEISAPPPSPITSDA